jgi:integrase/recombinase XerD
MIKFKLVILKKTQRANGMHLIFLRLTQMSKVKYISTNVECDLKENEWDGLKEVLTKTKRNDNIKKNQLINEVKNHWVNKYNILPIEKRELINIDDFVDYANSEKKQYQRLDFFEVIDTKIKNLLKDGKVGTSNSYKDLKNSVLRFVGGAKLNFENINLEWLKKYESHLRQRKCIDGGISVRMRAIRTLYNECIEIGLISLEKYPFKTYKIAKLKNEKNVRALQIEDIKKISELDTNKHPELKLSKDLFVFSYNTGGMNYKDMMLLKRENIYNENNRMTYVRSKTKGVFDFKLNATAKEIVEYYKKYSIGTEYLFPILLKDNLTPTQISNRRHKTISQFNKDLKTIGMLCNIDFDLTSYVARHSFASNLKDKGIATDVISEALGHQNLNITQRYLKRLENEVIDNAMDSLIDW